MARSYGTHFVITANTTDTGEPVYLRSDRSWSSSLAEARATQHAQERDEMLGFAAGQERAVCDPYAFKVNLDGDVPVVTNVRERIRSQGPTTPLRRPDVNPATPKAE